MSESEEIDESEYEQVGWFHVTEVERLFTALESEKIRFFFDASSTPTSAIDVVSASYGGSFGQSAQVLVWVHRSEVDKFQKVYRSCFEPEDDAVDWRAKLRNG